MTDELKKALEAAVTDEQKKAVAEKFKDEISKLSEEELDKVGGGTEVDVEMTQRFINRTPLSKIQRKDKC